MKVEDILNDLVSFNTVDDLENKKIMDYIENYLSRLGFKTEYRSKCLVMSIGNPVLSFIGHTDVVSVSDKWSYDPFKLTIDKDKLIGRGVSDMKGGIAAFLYTLSQINLKKLNKGIRVCFTYDEEKGFLGIKELIDNNIDFCKYTIVGEPTDNNPCIGSKGLLEYELIFKGRGVQSSRPIEDERSNEKAILFLNDVLKLEKRFKKERCDLFEFPFNTINVGVINGGTDINTTSSYTKVLLGFRITNNKNDITYIKKYIERLIKKYGKVEYKILNDINPFYLEDSIIEFYEKLTSKKRMPFFGVSEASFIDNYRLILGPGPVTAHEDNEYILKSSINETIKIYKEIIERICK